MIKLLTLLLLFNTLYSVTCNDFLDKIEEINSDHNKGLIIENSTEKATIYWDFELHAYIFHLKSRALYTRCDTKLNAIIFFDDNNQLLYRFILTMDTSLTIEDFFGNESFEKLLLAENKTLTPKLDYIIQKFTPNPQESLMSEEQLSTHKPMDSNPDDPQATGSGFDDSSEMPPSAKKPRTEGNSDSKIKKSLTTPSFISDKLDQGLIDFINKMNFFSKDYGILYKIPTVEESKMDKNQTIFTFNVYLKNLQPGKNFVLISDQHNEEPKKSISKTDKILGLPRIIVINKNDGSYNITKYEHTRYDISSTEISGVASINFKYQSSENNDIIVLRVRKSNDIVVNGYYILSENTSTPHDFHEQHTSMEINEKSEVYASMPNLLKSILHNYEVDENTRIMDTKYIKELITKSNIDEPFILINKDYLKSDNIDGYDINKRIGIILEPTPITTTINRRIFRINYIILAVQDGEYKFIINRQNIKGTASFDMKKSNKILISIYKVSDKTKEETTFKNLILVRDKKI